jgi:hypothetical protein
MGMKFCRFSQLRGVAAALRLRFCRIFWQPSLPTGLGAATREAHSPPYPDQNLAGFSAH